MVTRNVGEVSWFEVMGRDLERLDAFYSELFGWKLVRLPDMPYETTPEGWQGLPGGIGGGAEGPGWTTFYVRVDDVPAAVARAVAAGGAVRMPPQTLPGGTTVAVIADPEGHVVGLSHTA